MTITIDIRDDKVEQFWSMVREHDLAEFLLKDDGIPPGYQVPEWQKEAVRHTIANTRPEDYIPMEEVFAYLDKVARETEQ